MASSAQRTATAAVVSQRLCDLLYSFPSAAGGGIQWSALVRKYEERFSTRLDIQALGYDSALAAASALLWDVLRLADRDDMDNPVVAIEDAVAMTARPGSAATWPSLYRVLADAAQAAGTPGAREAAPEVLLSQLKPLLQSRWHADFDESALGYLTDEGSFVKIKKMKHLLQAVLRWREQRLAWRAAAGPRRRTSLDEATDVALELVPSKTHNDFILRCVGSGIDVSAIDAAVPPTLGVGRAASGCRLQQPCQSLPATGGETHSDAMSSSGGSSAAQSEEWQQELAALRAENAVLQEQNWRLELQACHAERRAEFLAASAAKPPLPPPRLAEVFDDPFEPPPERWCPDTTRSCSTGCSPGPVGSFGSSGSVTPISPLFAMDAASAAHSGGSTPRGSLAPPLAHAYGAPAPVCFMPVWFPLGDRASIPQGVVREACAFFERGSSTVLPSYFSRR